MLLISMCGESDLYGREGFVLSLFGKQRLLPSDLGENILKFPSSDILADQSSMKHNNG